MCKDERLVLPPLVLIHGWGFNSSVWGSIAPKLKNLYSVVIVDLPGYRSRPLLKKMTLSTIAADIQQQVESFGVTDKAIWLGWSLGGEVALQAALDLPDKIAKLILVAATPKFVQGSGWREAVKQKVLDDFGRELIKSRDSTIGRFLTLQMLGVPDSRDLLQKLKISLAEPLQDGALESGLEILNQTDIRSELQVIDNNIDSPTLWIMGGRDQLVPAAAGVSAADKMNRSNCIVIEAAAHAPFLSHPVEFMRALL